MRPTSLILAALLGAACSSNATSDVPALKGPVRLVSTPASAPAERDMNQLVRAMLNTYEAAPGKDYWLGLGPDAVPALKDALADTKLPDTRRARAAEILGWFDASVSVAPLKQVLADMTIAGGIRAGAVSGLSRALPHDEAVATIVPALADADDFVRFRAVLALRGLGGDVAKQAMAARLPLETSPSVHRMLVEAGAEGVKAPPSTTPSQVTP